MEKHYLSSKLVDAVSARHIAMLASYYPWKDTASGQVRWKWIWGKYTCFSGKDFL